MPYSTIWSNSTPSVPPKQYILLVEEFSAQEKLFLAEGKVADFVVRVSLEGSYSTIWFK